MSLLLDALKKAADDKQKALLNESANTDGISKSPAIADQVNDDIAASVSNETSIVTEELSLQDVDETQEVAEAVLEMTGNAAEVLTLDEDGNDRDLMASRLKSESVEIEELLPGMAGSRAMHMPMGGRYKGNAGAIAEEQRNGVSISLEHNENSSDSGAGSLTISDEALSMLIYKTNRDVKQGRRLLVFGVLAVSLTILVSGGVFYYMDMQEEISMLERKHQIAMQSMRLKTNREKTPSKSEIIRNLVSDADLDKKVQHAKQQLTGDKNVSKKDLAFPKKAGIKAQAFNARSAILSIQKTKKSDPVGEELDTAWRAYQSARYDEATILYKSVLSLEKNNRDALLGLGAIAVIKKDHAEAKNIYLTLLEQDPGDPIAAAALASLQSNQSSLDSDKEYLLSVLQKNPSAHHLNFALGNIYAQKNNWKSAQQYYFNAWKNNNENADYLFNLAVSMDQLSKQEQALKFYKECLFKSKNKQVSFSREAVKKRISELSGLS